MKKCIFVRIKQWTLTKKIMVSILLILIFTLISTGIQFAFNMNIEAWPSRPTEDFNAGGSDRLIYYFDQKAKGELDGNIVLNEEFINSQLEGTFRYINGRYDCADFRVNSLIRLYLGFGDELSEKTKADIKKVLLDFKYWMDQGGQDSMCYWSENHQILFAVEEYLVGQTFLNDKFSVDNKTGAEHMEMAKSRINAWMNQRFLYGFTEWYSNNYYPEDIAPMANFIQYAFDQEMVNRMKMIMDLLWHDMASQSFKYLGQDPNGMDRTYYIFMSSSGRMYSDNRMSDDAGNRMRDYIDYVMQPDETKDFDKSWNTSMNGFFNCFKQMMEARDENNQPYYTVPEVIKEIFDDNSSEKIIRSSQSLNVEELAQEGLLGQEVHQIMMQMNMEAFSNPEVVNNTIKYMARNQMFTNEFLNDFKLVNLWPLRTFGLLEGVSRTLQPSTNGVAIERANVYTYKTQNYSMHTAQAYQAGEYADQHAIQSVNLSNQVSVFTTQPAKIARRSGTPTYWTGNGRQPYSVQEKNVNISIYLPPTKIGFMELMIIKETTHIFFPVELFSEYDETRLADGYIFGRVNNSYIAIKSRYPLAFVDFAISNDANNKDDMLKRGSVAQVLNQKYDLVQKGEGAHYFVTELSDSSVETFDAFKQRFINNELSFNANINSLTYKTILNLTNTLTTLNAVYAKSFSVNGVLQNLEYQRFESNYVKTGVVARKADEIEFSYNNHSLKLNYQENRRLEG